MLAFAALLPFLPQEPPLPVDAGPLRVEIHVARTAQLFHVVDQLSMWSQFCHAQYARWYAAEFGPSAAAEADLLAQHTRLRALHGWGQGLEQALYTAQPLDAALAAAVAGKQLTAAEAATEREVLLHFAPRLDPLLAQQRERLVAFARRFASDAGRLRSFARRLARFSATPRVEVPVFLVADPADHDCGGGYNGGRLVVEVPLQDDAMPILLHELVHAFLRPQRPALAAAAAAAGLSDLAAETLDEGIAYALAPGIHHDERVADPLAAAVARDIAAGSGLDDALVRYRRFGLALRPLLRQALDDEAATLGTFLPRALDAWRVLRELETARAGAARPK